MSKINKIIELQTWRPPIENPKKGISLSIDQVYELIRTLNGNKVSIDKFNRIRNASKPERDKLKKEISFIIPASNSRKQSEIKSYTGIAVLDFDGVNGAEELRDKVFRLPYCMSAFISPSGNGVKAFISIPICESVDEFRARYNALKYEIERWFPELDSSASGPQLPMFLSYDSDIKTRDDYTTFDGILEPKIYSTQQKDFSYSATETDLYKIQCYIRKELSSINELGHPNVQKMGLFTGQLCCGYNINVNELIPFAESLIASHGYLMSKKSKYIKTFNWAIRTGYNNGPTQFNN